MTVVGDLELDEKRLFRRVGFLQDRARAHLQHTGARRVMNVACAGNLLRDAAATALLLEQYEEARDLLVQAGKHWESIGLFAGYALLSMARSRAWWAGRRSRLSAVAEELELASRPHFKRSSEGRSERAPMMAGSAGSTRQLLHLYQSVRPNSDGDGLASFVSDLARKRLLESSTAQVGATEVPVRSYLHLLDATVHGDFDGAARNTLSGIVFRRVEQLEAARSDAYHWRMGLAPAALVDFDIVALVTSSMNSQQIVAEVAEHFGGRSRAVALPLIAARGLRPNAPDGPPQRE